MANLRSDFETDLHRFQDMLRWTDGVAAIGATIFVLLLILVWRLT